ncbi:circadian clock KaiB family protein [Halomonas vilamensis]|uniref:Circadian clock KaiB family protein n=1 Tax=Vreelandella vilamensis TaxID=531309 RepID=A0ABU1H7M8_9GAMM|nr:circadian clock KaiB family protein [Halomonas vilamensis]MDR5900303.1 circadian clock KaiB family protein [Halomonas vilamensis]
MSNQQPAETPMPMLMLFVTGTAPRSQRARANLAKMLDQLNLSEVKPFEVDLLEQPEQGIEHAIFATPSLLKFDTTGEVSVLYGDLSAEERLQTFLSDLDQPE